MQRLLEAAEGISLKFGAKVPGTARQLSSVDMNFSYASALGIASPEAFERLIVDCMLGDSTLFIRRDEEERPWHSVDSITNTGETGLRISSPIIQQEAGGKRKPMRSSRTMDANGRIRPERLHH